MEIFFNKHGPATNPPSIMHCLTNRNPKFPAADLSFWDQVSTWGLPTKTQKQTTNNLFLPPNSTSHTIMSSNFFIISSHHQEGCQHRKQHGCVDLHNFDLFGTLGWHIIPSPRCQPRHHRLQLRQLRPCGGALSPPHACGAGDGGATYGCFREGGAVIGWLVEDVYGWKPKNRGIYPKMDGENNGKTLWAYSWFWW